MRRTSLIYSELVMLEDDSDGNDDNDGASYYQAMSESLFDPH